MSQMLSTLHDVHGLTHAGPVRAVNEDAIAWWQDTHLPLTCAILADGMGGHQGGALASQLAVDAVEDTLREAARHWRRDMPPSRESRTHLLEMAARAGNAAICLGRTHQPGVEKMGTTLVVALIWQQEITLLHAGDSRAYLFHAESGPLEQLTRDDSVVQAMLDEGAIRAEDIPNIPYRNVLTNALGIQDTLHCTTTQLTARPGDVLLLCSDGLHDVVSADDIRHQFSQSMGARADAEALMQLSLRRRTPDNSSLIVVRLNESGPRAPETDI
ncbi:MAG: serine/threonine-protein phosphatase [Gammaproteobacteria bacterium]|nr:MAG: serine/threonine-protein phosphatase [Gammaproteobacteria bacterium]